MAKIFQNPYFLKAQLHDVKTGEKTAQYQDQWAYYNLNGDLCTHPTKKGAEKLAPLNVYEQKQEYRRERLLDAATRYDEKSQEAYERSDIGEKKSGIPFGQPILVGHHSERKHRRLIKRACAAADMSIKHRKTAEYLRRKADTVGLGGVSSDDPEAIEKLREQLTQRETNQINMKACNVIIRKWDKKGLTFETTGAEFVEYFMDIRAISNITSEKAARDLIGNIYPAYMMSNNNTGVKRLKDRIAQLEEQRAATYKKVRFDGVCDVVENVVENRLQIIFDGKPSEKIRATLKQKGFRWSPSQNAWQRQLNNRSRYAAKGVCASLGVMIYS